MPDSANLFHMQALLESDFASLAYILHFFALCRVAQSQEARHNTPTLNTSLDVHVLMVTAF